MGLLDPDLSRESVRARSSLALTNINTKSTFAIAPKIKGCGKSGRPNLGLPSYSIFR